MKKVFFALFAVVIAVGGSAFTNANVETLKIYGSTSENYTKRTSTYNSAACEADVDKVCAYQVTTAGEAIVIGSSYTDEEMQDFLDNNLVIQLPGAASGTYSGL